MFYTNLLWPGVVEGELALDVGGCWEAEQRRGVANPQQLQKVLL